ncbi:hypothetical protein MN608_10801 [Microdochium nivale]|nr:hypothetical protein MN608_10801 [Microdochium nivale]
MVLRRTWQNLQDAENDIKNFAEFLGFALIRRRSGNRDPGTGKPTRIHYCCHLDAARKPAIAPEDRKRKRESAASITKRDEPCPWQICLKWNKRRGTQPHLFQLWHLVWTGGTETNSHEHNHDMDPDPANIPANRRRHFTDEIKEEIMALLAEGGHSSSQIVDVMKKRHPRIEFTKNMVDNQRRVVIAKKEAAAAGGGEVGTSADAAASSGQAEPAGSGDDNDDDNDGDEDEEMDDSMANTTEMSVVEA